MTLRRPPPRSPRRVERNDDGTLPAVSHARERIISQVGLRYLVDVVSGLYYGTEARLRGDRDAGEFILHDGCGNLELFFWNADGVAGAAFEGDSSAPADCFPRAPEQLRPLVERAIEVSRGQLTGGLWVTAGDDAKWAEEGSFTDSFVGYTMTPDAALGGGTDEERRWLRQSWAELASLSEAHVAVVKALHARVAEGPCEVTDQERAILMTSPEGEEAEEDAVGAGMKRLAVLGVRWAPPP